MTTFVGGVHGAGKTFVTKGACDALQRRYATASQLIRERRGSASWQSNKVVSDVDSNQLALVEAVQEINARGVPLVLDGHFVLRTAPNEHSAVPVAVFEAIQCSAIILIECPVVTLQERLTKRGDISWTKDELHRFVEAERWHAEEVSRTLAITLVKLDAPNQAVMEAWLRRL